MRHTTQLPVKAHTINIHCLTRDGSLSVVSSETGAYWPFNVLYVWFASQLPDDNCHMQNKLVDEVDRKYLSSMLGRTDLEMPCASVLIFVIFV